MRLAGPSGSDRVVTRFVGQLHPGGPTVGVQPQSMDEKDGRSVWCHRFSYLLGLYLCCLYLLDFHDRFQSGPPDCSPGAVPLCQTVLSDTNSYFSPANTASTQARRRRGRSTTSRKNSFQERRNAPPTG